MPSFDVVSEVDEHELANAIDQANREISNRVDFQGSDARVDYAEPVLTIFADDEFKAGQVRDILEPKLVKRGIDIGCLEPGEVEERGGGKVEQKVTVRRGIDTALGKKLVKKIKSSKMKVQAAIQGEQLRITGKKRDDLQAVIALLKEEDTGLPLQYTNFRD